MFIKNLYLFGTYSLYELFQSPRSNIPSACELGLAVHAIFRISCVEPCVRFLQQTRRCSFLRFDFSSFHYLVPTFISRSSLNTSIHPLNRRRLFSSSIDSLVRVCMLLDSLTVYHSHYNNLPSYPLLSKFTFKAHNWIILTSE